MTALVSRLDALRDAVVAGRFAEADAISAGIETDLVLLADLSGDDLGRVRQAAEASARCLQAALRGTRDARRRIEELVAAERPQTYGGDGRKQDLAAEPGGRRV